MNIGLDIDNVITAFDSAILKEFKIEDKNKRNNGIINKHAQNINYGMFDWSEEEVQEFYNNNMERIASNLKCRKNCKLYMDKIIEDGHKIFLISHRAYPHYIEPFLTTENWLKKHKINYDKLILSEQPDKTKECKEYKIDIMLDDRVDQCRAMRDKGVNCILMLTKYNKRIIKGVPYVSSWKSFYEVVKEWKG